MDSRIETSRGELDLARCRAQWSTVPNLAYRFKKLNPNESGKVQAGPYSPMQTFSLRHFPFFVLIHFFFSPASSSSSSPFTFATYNH